MGQSQNNERLPKSEQMNAAIREFCSRSFGVLDSQFLCQSVGVMNPPAPVCIDERATVQQVLEILKEKNIGCALITGTDGVLTGIFTERDCVRRVFGAPFDPAQTPITAVMTADPVAESPEATTAFALNLMSQGGFRHLPLVDGERRPVGVISVKDIVDFIVETFTRDLLEFPVETIEE